MSGRLLASVALAALLSMTLLQAGAAHAAGNATIRVYIEGPNALGLNKSGEYKVLVVGAEGPDWKYEAYFTNGNTTNATPTKNTPLKGNVTETSVLINVTAPSVKGAVDLYVNVSKGTEWRDAVKTIQVVQPLSVSCQVENPSKINIDSLPVQIYIDDVLVDTQRISISAGQSTNITADWIVANPPAGAHTLVIKGDVDGDGVVSPGSGDIYTAKTFYLKQEGFDWFYGVVLAVAVAAILIGMILIARRKKA
ncbi:MAG: hypothetical protein HZB92_04325 [Euryarchaeota archaeon]|nr:hypothetical protein [Euryarchaeota archaeon]